MSQQSDMAEDVYTRMGQRPVASADLVHELRARWGPEPGVGSVHRFVEEVVACLLHHDDVQVCDMTGGRFTPWSLEPWDAYKKIADELMSMDVFFLRIRRDMFSSKRKRPNQSPEPTTGRRLNG
jgi:hypothetical protein